jgi:hypothetical protein
MTMPPENADPAASAVLRELMRDKSTQWCTEFFQLTSWRFVKMQASKILKDVPDDPDAQRYF